MSERMKYNGRFIKKKTLEYRLAKIKNVVSVRKASISLNKEKKKKGIENKIVAEGNVCEGRRIVDVQVLGNNLKCCKCNKVLSMENIKSERIIGLHSVWSVMCTDCDIETQVHTGKTHSVADDTLADVNTRTLLGVLHSGSGLSGLNKLLACLNIPSMTEHTYKKYEEEVGLTLEEAAKESCTEAAQEEREQTIINVEKLCRELPSEILDHLYPELETLYTCDYPEGEKIPPQKRMIFDEAVGNIVHIIVSYDMGWSKRGNGKSYDSLNGYSTIIGFLSKKVLDYTTRNRKCSKCDRGHSSDDHLCRKNYSGSAKAMEPDAAVQLVNKSEVLKKVGLDIRALIADDDSSTIAAILKGSLHKIFKLSCRVHLSRNFVKGLYQLKKRHSQLGRQGVIGHLRKCFSYALAQNIGNAPKLSNCILSIRDHVFDQHENCGDWCRCDELRKPTVLLTDPDLYSALHEHLLKYANNAAKFTVNATSQANENFNAIVSHRMPKGHCYSLSASADFRVAGAVLSKNEGDSHLMKMEKKLSLSPGKHTRIFATKRDAIRRRKNENLKVKETKLRRILLKKRRENLRKKNESNEGVQYQRNCGIEMGGDANNTPGQLPALVDIGTFNLLHPSENCRLVFFDLETSGLKKSADIVQIAAKCDDRSFSTYIDPTQPIDEEASKVTGLKNIGGKLVFNGKVVESIPLQAALLAFSEFMNDTINPSLLVAHNAPFDVPRLFRAIENCSMFDDFQFIAGYTDTLPLLRKNIPDRKGEGMFKLATLAKDFLNVTSTDNFHEALYDVGILQEITSLKITKTDLVVNAKCFFEPFIHPTLAPLTEATSNMMIKRISNQGITFGMMKTEYLAKGRDGIVRLLSREIGNKGPRVTKDKKTLNKIIEVFQNLPVTETKNN